jgi:hypothetical protein
MRAFAVSIVLLVGIAVAAGVALNSIDMSSETVFSKGFVRH